VGHPISRFNERWARRLLMSALGHGIYLTVTFVTKRFRQRGPYTKLFSLGGFFLTPGVS
jgi:hypothetical protein